MTHVVITGCNRGIGAALAAEALARGWRVTGTVREAGSAPEGVEERVCDMREIAGIGAAFAGLGPVDVLINNAGVIGPAVQGTLEMDFGGFADTLTINTLAPLAVTHAVLPAMSAGARVLSVSSQMAFMGYAKSDRIAYRASKAALNKVMQGLATDLAERGICVVPV
ncbi:MAG: SDR family NAD(P)-dependent oxidoreductase, partial [Pseudomonadota bacterium]